MKVRVFHLLIISVVLLLCSCATTSEKSTDYKGSAVENTQSQIDVITGQGNSKFVLKTSSQSAADANAITDIGSKIKQIIKESLVQYLSVSDSRVRTALEEIIQQTANLASGNSNITERYFQKDGTCWSYASYPIAGLPVHFNSAANKYLEQLGDKRTNTQKKLDELLSSIGDASDTESVMLKDLAQQKASELLDEIKIIESSIDIQAMVRTLKEWLENKGYNLKSE